MTSKGITIGIDKQDNKYFVARVDNSAGRPDVKALVRFDVDHFNGHHLLEGNQLVISFPNEQTMIKYIQIQSEENAEQKVQFELETELLDSPDDFLFDIITTGLPNYFIGLSVHKKIISDMIQPFIKHNGDHTFSSKGLMRSVALGRGFLTFCQQSGGDLGAIIDFSEKSASMAIYYKNKIVDIIGLPLQNSYSNSEKNFQRLAIDLKTLLNFKLGTLAKKGITVPLSKLFILGDLLTETHKNQMKDILKVDITQPEIHTGFFREKNNNSDISLSNYLVALGLTVV